MILKIRILTGVSDKQAGDILRAFIETPNARKAFSQSPVRIGGAVFFDPVSFVGDIVNIDVDNRTATILPTISLKNREYVLLPAYSLANGLRVSGFKIIADD